MFVDLGMGRGRKGAEEETSVSLELRVRGGDSLESVGPKERPHRHLWPWFLSSKLQRHPLEAQGAVALNDFSVSMNLLC